MVRLAGIEPTTLGFGSPNSHTSTSSTGAASRIFFPYFLRFGNTMGTVRAKNGYIRKTGQREVAG